MAELSEMTPLQKRLRRMMKKHDLRSQDVAKIVKVQAQTVRCWCSGRQRTPYMAVELLRLKLT